MSSEYLATSALNCVSANKKQRRRWLFPPWIIRKVAVAFPAKKTGVPEESVTGYISRSVRNLPLQFERLSMNAFIVTAIADQIITEALTEPIVSMENSSSTEQL